MITREQAENAVQRERSGEDREIRIISLEPCQMSQERPVHGAAELGGVDMEEQGWSCHFEWRDKQPDGSWGQWYGGYCYVVAAKPGPYVIK